MERKLELEPDSESDYIRKLAELTPDERLRLLEINFDLQRVLERKLAHRRKLAELSAAEKLQLLEELRNRAEIQRGSRRTHSSPTKSSSPQFGGRAAASGVNYEVRIAALIAVKMLAGSGCSVLQGIPGGDVSAITMQADEPVDDIVVSLSGDPKASIFIAAKERSGPVPLTASSPAFADTVDAFVRQFLKLPASSRSHSRLLWAVPSCVGRAATHALPNALNSHRMDAGDTSLADFVRARRSPEKKALEGFLSVARSAWKKIAAGNLATEDDLRSLLRQVYVEVYDFGAGQRLELQAETDIRNHIVADAKQAGLAWQKIQTFFADVNQRGIRVTPVSLRRALSFEGLTLKSSPDYAQEIRTLREMTSRNQAALKPHTVLNFGPSVADVIHIERPGDLSPLLDAAKSGHFLITGEPGCGKSGLIFELVERLQGDGIPVVLLLAEEIFGRGENGPENLPGLVHDLDEVLANWPDGARGVLVTDALDAVRSPETQQLLRRLLRNVKTGQSGWTVVASVREFDLKFGRELREMFPGEGVAGHVSNDFAGVAHFHLGRLSEGQLDQLASQRADIRPFIESARQNAKSEGIHRSPFYLRLAAELLREKVPSTRLADWNSPAILLRKFWENRVTEGEGANERLVALRAICRRMADARSMAVSLKELPLGAPELPSVDELRGRGILKSPLLLHGTRVGGDDIQFTHHLLHDYAIARCLIPESQKPFCDFTIRETLLPIFYRQSFLFALEEIWDADPLREGYWQTALKLESESSLHGITRILAPILAARRVASLADLKPLLMAVSSDNNADSPGQKALRHLASGFHDAQNEAIRAGAAGWCAFAEQLGKLLTFSPSIEAPLAHVLARLNAARAVGEGERCLAFNAAARSLLACHVAKPVGKRGSYSALVAIEGICRTFKDAPAQSKAALLALMSPERLNQFPHHDLHDLAESIRYLGVEGEAVVLCLFEAAFSNEPEAGEWEPEGGMIMPMRFQTRDSWHMVQYSLAGFYEAYKGENAALMTDAACIAWNGVLRRRGRSRNRRDRILATVQFRGVTCELVEDWFHIGRREFENEENRILSHFEKTLREWAAVNDVGRLNSALDHFAARNQTALLWTIFFEAGAEYPATLGALLEGVLSEPVFLTHPDYAYGGATLLGALHKAGDQGQRERLESLILNLPNNVRPSKEESSESVRSRIEYALDRLLNVLEEPNIVLDAVRELRRAREEVTPLPSNPKAEGPRVISRTLSEKEILESRGINLQTPENTEMLRLRDALKPFLQRNNIQIDPKEAELRWPVIQQCESALERYGNDHPQMAAELWGHLVSACENIARSVHWPNTSEHWETVRRVLLKAADDPVPPGDNDDKIEDDDWPSWGWPSPRLDAAGGLPFLALRLGQADDDIAQALRRLCRDKSHPLRFNLADRLAALHPVAPDLMWELIDTFIANEKRFSVLAMLLGAMNRLPPGEAAKVKPRLRLIADRARQGASADDRIHEILAGIYLFAYLRGGDSECRSFIGNLIAECDSQRAGHALLTQLHACRVGGWLTAGDAVTLDPKADEARNRTWGFFAELLAASQAKLLQHRAELQKLVQGGEADGEIGKDVRAKMERAMHLVDGIAMQLFFACGAFEEKNNKSEKPLSEPQLRRFWQESAPLFHALSSELHPHTAYQLVQTFQHLLPCSPAEIFLLATRSILSSGTVGFQYESLAIGEVVKLIQRVLADHRDVFRGSTAGESECLAALLRVLDLFVEAGWSEARQLTHRLEEIYR
jgi:hypothetical protein